MVDEAQQESCSGVEHSRVGFEDVDMRYQLKTRHLIKICLPPVFDALNREFRLKPMREQGIAPIMFDLRFGAEPRPIAVFGKLEAHYEVKLFRSVTPSSEPDAPTLDRLMLEMNVQVRAEAGSGNPHTLGGREHGPMVDCAYMRGLHVLTRPVAPRGQRQVREVPPELARLREHRWPEAYPAPENMQETSQGFNELDPGAWREQRNVWGLHNTDVNQHVNVHEYVFALENHYSRLLYGAGLPVAGHHIRTAHVLFRKPFFMGQQVAVLGRALRKGRDTALLAGCHHVDAEGSLEPRPAVFARMEGNLDPEG